jgi:hypothetical protein
MVITRIFDLYLTDFVEVLEKGNFLEFSASTLMHLRQSF